MEIRQFFTVNLNPLVTKISSSKWSDDNNISIITEKGVHVIKIVPSPTQFHPILKINRSFIDSPTSLPGEILMDDLEKYIYDWKKEDIFLFLMEEALTPKFPNISTTITYINEVSWSSKILIHPFNCLLSVATSAGAVEIFHQYEKSWKSIYNFTAEWSKKVYEEYKLNDLNKIENLTKFFKNQLRRLQATTITWSDFCNDNFTYFVTAYRNSEIAIWKVYYEFQNNESIKVELKITRNLDIQTRINKLLWISLNNNSYLLIIGCFNGQIYALKFYKNQEEISFSSVLYYYEEIDLIPIDYIKKINQNKEFIEIAVIKGMFLMILQINFFGEIINTKFLQIPGFSITGLSVTNDDKLLITTQNGQLILIKRENNELIYEFLSAEFKTDIQYLGFSSSLNHLLHMVVTRPNRFDHLVDREPSSLIFFTNYNEKLDLPMLLYQNKEKVLPNLWDYFETIKVNAFKHNVFKEIPQEKLQKLEQLEISELKIIYWLMIIGETWKTKKGSKDKEMSEKIKEIQFLIFLHSACNYLKHLTCINNFTNHQRNSIKLLKKALENWLEKENIVSKLQEEVKNVLGKYSSFQFDEEEKCHLCEEVINDISQKECSAGHNLLRCAKTYLQISEIKFRSCKKCKKFYHPCLDSETNIVQCIYCDDPIFYDDRIM